jgi:glyoxylase-like metal-dependent hydrolase (beta-lactamase superfamily II)
VKTDCIASRAKRWTVNLRALVGRMSLALGMVFVTATANAQDLVLTPLKVSPHVYYFRGETGMADTRNQGFMSNAGFVVTRDGVIVFDALGTPALGVAMVNAIRKITPLPIRRIIISHYHADHFYGLQALKAAGAEVWAHEGGSAYLSSDAAPSRLAQRKADLGPWVNNDTRLVPADRWLHFDASRTIAFDYGGMHFRVINMGGAHSAEDIMLAVDDDKVLFAGDLFFSGRIPFVGEADSKIWLGYLDEMLRIAPAIVVPGHGEMSRAPMKDLQLTRSYLLFLRRLMGEAVADMVPFEDAYRKADWSAFASYPAFAQANRINAYQTYLLMERESLQQQ